MHCFYGVGAFVSPMIASAFLLNKDCTPFIDGFNISTDVVNAYSTYGHIFNSTLPNHKPRNITRGHAMLHVLPQPQRVFRYTHMSRLPTAFYILGTLQVIIGVDNLSKFYDLTMQFVFSIYLSLLNTFT